MAVPKGNQFNQTRERMMEPYRIKVMDNINDKLNRLFKIKQLEYKRKDIWAYIDSYNYSTSNRSREEDASRLSSKYQQIDTIDAQISKLLEDE